MKKNANSEKVLTFFAKNVGFVGLLTVINFLLIYFLFDKLQSTDQRLQRLEMATGNVMKEINSLSQPILDEESAPSKK